MSQNPTQLYLSASDANLTVSVNLMDPNTVMVEAGGFNAPPPEIRTYHNRKKGTSYQLSPYRKITVKVLVSGTDGAATWANFRAVEAMLDRARKASRTASGFGDRISLWCMLLGGNAFTYFDLTDGQIEEDTTRRPLGGQRVYATLSLTCLTTGRGARRTVYTSGTLVNGAATVFVSGIPGDTDALAALSVVDHSTAGAINVLRVGRKSLPGLTSADFIPLLGTLPQGAAVAHTDATSFNGTYARGSLGVDWTQVAAAFSDGQGAMSGRVDVWARIRDGALFSGTPVNLSYTLSSWDGLVRQIALKDIVTCSYTQTYYINNVEQSQSIDNVVTSVPVGQAYTCPAIATIDQGGGDKDTFTLLGQARTTVSTGSALYLTVVSIYSDGSESGPAAYVTIPEPADTATINLTWTPIGAPVDTEIRYMRLNNPSLPIAPGNVTVVSRRTGSGAGSYAISWPDAAFTFFGTDPTTVMVPGASGGGTAVPSAVRMGVAVSDSQLDYHYARAVVLPGVSANWQLIYLGTFWLPPALQPDRQPLLPWQIVVEGKNRSTATTSVSLDVDSVALFPHDEAQFAIATVTGDRANPVGYYADMNRYEEVGAVVYRPNIGDTPTQGMEEFTATLGKLTLGPGNNILSFVADREGGISDFVNTKFAVSLTMTPRYNFLTGIP